MVEAEKISEVVEVQINTRHADGTPLTLNPTIESEPDKSVNIILKEIPPNETILKLEVKNKTHYYLVTQPMCNKYREKYSGTIFFQKLMPKDLENLENLENRLPEEDLSEYLNEKTLENLQIKRPVASPN